MVMSVVYQYAARTHIRAINCLSDTVCRKMHSVEIQLPEELSQFVRREVEAGRYDSTEEVIEAALIQMKDRANRLQEVRRRFLERDVDQLLEATA
jgi:putative addiction module CopG family antidote